MDAINAAMRKLFALGWAPFDGMPPWIGLLVLGVAFGVAALIAMKYTTNPKRVTRFKDRYQGHILAIRLFRDSFTVVISSLVKTLGWVGCYLGEQFKPMIVMLVPFMLLFAQMQMRLAYRPLPLNEPTIVTVDVANAKTLDDVALQVSLPDGLALAGKMVRSPAAGRIVVPLVATQAGAYVARFTIGGETVEKTLHAGDLPGAPMVSPMRSSGFEDRLLYPSEDSFGAGSRFTKIELKYPVRPLDCFGVDLAFGSEIGMMIVFVLLTIVAAFGLKGVFGVTI